MHGTPTIAIFTARGLVSAEREDSTIQKASASLQTKRAHAKQNTKTCNPARANKQLLCPSKNNRAIKRGFPLQL